MSTPSNYNWIDKAEKTGDLSVRVKLKRPTPAALEYFALVIPIYPKAYREKVGAEGYAKAPVGAGPYKITKVEPGVSIDFERFEDYWAGSPKGKPAIKKLSVRFVPDATTEMTELLAGRADWIWNMNPDQFDTVNKMPHLQAVRKESMRVGYLSLDAAGRTGADNPLTKLKVRQAIWHAIDRQAIADKLVTGGSRVPAAPCFPPQFGCDAEAAVLYDYNPAKAKQLLAEAGYPDGFDVELASYVLPQWGSAVQNYLHAVGIRAKLNQLQVAALIQRAKAGELRTYLGSWGSYSINDVSAILPNFFDGGADDYARDPDVQKWLVEGGSSNDPEVRKKAYSAAIKQHHRAGLLGAAAHLCDDLRLLQAARLHAVPGRAAALLSGEVEVKPDLTCGRSSCALRGALAPRPNAVGLTSSGSPEIPEYLIFRLHSTWILSPLISAGVFRDGRNPDCTTCPCHEGRQNRVWRRQVCLYRSRSIRHGRGAGFSGPDPYSR